MYEVEINAKEGTPEFSKQMYSAMEKCMNDLISKLYKDGEDRKPNEIVVRMTNGMGWKVEEIEHLGKTLCTRRVLKYVKTKEEGEKYKEGLVASS